jgi:hypothetical protein
MENSLLPEFAQGKVEAEPHSKRRKRNSDTDNDRNIRIREATEKCRPLTVYQKPRAVVTKNFYAPLRAVPTEGAKLCDKTPSSQYNLVKGRSPP